jgi:hypothetical protein
MVIDYLGLLMVMPLVPPVFARWLVWAVGDRRIFFRTLLGSPFFGFWFLVSVSARWLWQPETLATGCAQKPQKHFGG